MNECACFFFIFISDVHGLLKVLYDPDDTYSAGMKESINALSLSKTFNICVVNNIASDPDENSFYPLSLKVINVFTSHVSFVSTFYFVFIL